MHKAKKRSVYNGEKASLERKKLEIWPVVFRCTFCIQTRQIIRYSFRKKLRREETGVKSIIKKSRLIVTKLFLFQQCVQFAYFNVIFDNVILKLNCSTHKF